MRDNWKVQWSDKDGLINEFQKHKAKYLDRAWKVPDDRPHSRRDFRVYVIGQ